jgi:hypothetical protein
MTIGGKSIRTTQSAQDQPNHVDFIMENIETLYKAGATQFLVLAVAYKW